MRITIKITDYLFHCMAYYLAWFSAILLAANSQNDLATLIVMVTVILQAVWQYCIARRVQGLWLMLTLFLVAGTLVDSLLIKAGLIELSANPFGNSFSAPWMCALWLSFAMTFYSLLPSFFERYLLVSIVSLISFPLAYAAGVKLNAAQLPHGYIGLLVIGIIWAMLFPFVLKIYHAIERSRSDHIG